MFCICDLWVYVPCFGTDIPWRVHLSLSAMNHDWSVISTGGVNMFISLTFHHSISAPRFFQSSHQIVNAFGHKKSVCCQGGMDPAQVERGLTAQTCWLCRLFTHFQWLIPEESEDTSTTWFLWHCQLLLSPHHRGFMSHSTCLSSAGAHHLSICVCCCDRPYWSICTCDWNSSRCRVLWGFGPPTSSAGGFMWRVTWVTGWE